MFVTVCVTVPVFLLYEFSILSSKFIFSVKGEFFILFYFLKALYFPFDYSTLLVHEFLIIKLN